MTVKTTSLCTKPLSYFLEECPNLTRLTHKQEINLGHADDNFHPVQCFKHESIRELLERVHQEKTNIQDFETENFTVRTAIVICPDGLLDVTYKYKVGVTDVPVFLDDDYCDDVVEEAEAVLFSDIHVHPIRL